MTTTGPAVMVQASAMAAGVPSCSAAIARNCSSRRPAGGAGAADQQVSEPLLRLFHRGVDDGTLRIDLPAEALLGSFADLIEGSIIRSARTYAGVEETSAAVLSIFLSGALGSRVTPARA